MYTAKRTWFWTSDYAGVVPETDPTAAFLLVRAGCQVDDATAARLALAARESGEGTGEDEQVNDTDGKALDGPPVTKHVKGPRSRK